MIIFADDGVAQMGAVPHHRAFPQNAPLDPHALTDAHVVAQDAWTGDRRALADTRARPDPHRPFDEHALAYSCRRIDAGRTRRGNRKGTADDVGARATVLRWRSDVAPIGTARVETVERIAGRLQRRKHLFAEIEKRLLRNVCKNLRRERVDAGV